MEELKQYAAILKDPESRAEIMTMINEGKEDIYPILEFIKDIIGDDIDKFIDETIKWKAKKSFVAYVAYQKAGFNKIEAMQLTLNMREDVASAIRHVKTS